MEVSREVFDKLQMMMKAVASPVCEGSSVDFNYRRRRFTIILSTFRELSFTINPQKVKGTAKMCLANTKTYSPTIIIELTYPTGGTEYLAVKTSHAKSIPEPSLPTFFKLYYTGAFDLPTPDAEARDEDWTLVADNYSAQFRATEKEVKEMLDRASKYLVIRSSQSKVLFVPVSRIDLIIRK